MYVDSEDSNGLFYFSNEAHCYDFSFQPISCHHIELNRNATTLPRDLKRSLVFEDLEQRNLMAAWVSQGPFSSINGQVEGITNRPVSGAIHAVIAHPTNPDILYAGSINGGVWKTTNATNASPSWTPTTDNQSSNSIGALAFDQADPTFQTVWAGNGRYGSFGQRGGTRSGLLRTTDGGTTWTRITGNGVLVGKNISGIVANGSTIVVSVNIADATSNATTGIFRSSDGGIDFYASQQCRGDQRASFWTFV